MNKKATKSSDQWPINNGDFIRHCKENYQHLILSMDIPATMLRDSKKEDFLVILEKAAFVFLKNQSKDSQANISKRSHRIRTVTMIPHLMPGLKPHHSIKQMYQIWRTPGINEQEAAVQIIIQIEEI